MSSRLGVVARRHFQDRSTNFDTSRFVHALCHTLSFEDVAMADTALQRNLQQRQLVESDKLRAALSIDDVSFRNSLLETGVLSTKEDTKWSIDLVFDVLQGPLRNPKRLDEAMRASKFMKRLLAFFHPLNLRYSDIRKDDVSQLSLTSSPSNPPPSS